MNKYKLYFCPINGINPEQFIPLDNVTYDEVSADNKRHEVMSVNPHLYVSMVPVNKTPRAQWS